MNKNMTKNYKSIFTILVILCVSLFSLMIVSCSYNDQEETLSNTNGLTYNLIHSTELLTYHIDTIAFRNFIEVLTTNNLNQKIFSQTIGNKVYFIYNEVLGFDPENPRGFDENIESVINLASISIDGQNFSKLQLETDDGFSILGFNITHENSLMVLVSEIIHGSSSSELSFLLLEFDFSGNELGRIRLEGFLTENQSSIDVVQVVLLESGYIVANIKGEETNYLEIYNIQDGNCFKLKLNSLHNNHNGLVVTANNRLLVMDVVENIENEEITVLREIDFYTESFISAFYILADSNTGLFSSFSNTTYDLLISDNDILYGFNLDTLTQKPLLQWDETGVVGFDRPSSLVGINEEGKIYVLRSGLGLNLNIGEMLFHSLTPVYRDELSDKIELTLGAIVVSGEMRSAVTAFNNTNQEYHINIVSYIDYVGGLTYDNEDFIRMEAAAERLRIDLSIGRGPDIFIGRLPLFPYLDLYPLIDADSRLERTDFIHSILASAERADGSLPFIPQEFDFSTYISTSDMVGDIELWTPEEMVALIERNSHIVNPFGDSGINTSSGFIFSQLNNRADLINWDAFTANLNSEEFISLLNTSLIFQSEWPENIPLANDSFYRLLTGEQLLIYEHFGNIDFFQFLVQVIGEEMVLLGEPTKFGSTHFINHRTLIGINKYSEHIAGAWEFIRSILLGEIALTNFLGFPTRVDAFEAILKYATTPQYIYDENGNIRTDSEGNNLENPHFSHGVMNIVSDTDFTVNWYDVYSMPEEAANMLRNIVYEAKPNMSNFNFALSEIISADLSQFFNGARSAEDTARIIQSRVEIFLAEQELVYRNH